MHQKQVKKLNKTRWVNAGVRDLKKGDRFRVEDPDKNTKKPAQEWKAKGEPYVIMHGSNRAVQWTIDVEEPPGLSEQLRRLKDGQEDSED